MIYTVFVRQIREVHIQAENAQQLQAIMEGSFKPEEHSELEEWRCHAATNPDGTIRSADIDMCWRKFPEKEDEYAPGYMTAKDFLPYVRNGAELLNQIQPGWRGLIDQNRLDMGRSDTCLLGQLYGSFSAAFKQPELRFMRDRVASYGFDIFNWASPDSAYEYMELGKAWKLILAS